MQLQLIRDESAPTATTGRIQMPDGIRTLSTIELPWNDNAPDASCVPVGSYALIPYLSPTHGLVYRLHNPDCNVYGEGVVPESGRSAIEIHPANFATQLLGCIAVGVAAGEMLDPDTNSVQPAVYDSQRAMLLLRGILGSDSGHTLVIS